MSPLVCIALNLGHVAYHRPDCCFINSLIVSFYFFQLKRLKLRKNNWDCETYQFDEVLTETASQKRVYEVVAKPVVEVGAFLS